MLVWRSFGIAHPAQVFMGMSVLLALGAMLGTIAVMVRQNRICNYGCVFVMEAVSVFFTNRLAAYA